MNKNSWKLDFSLSFLLNRRWIEFFLNQNWALEKVPKFLKSGSGSKKYFRFAELFKDLNTDQRSWSRSFFVSDLKRIWSRSFFRRRSVKDLGLDPCFGKRSKKDLNLDPFSEVIRKRSELDPFLRWSEKNRDLCRSVISEVI